MRTSIVRRYRFEAAHRLPWHPGQCATLHGHSYVLEIEARGELDERGVVMDFAELDALVDPIVDALDHSYLNEQMANPTAEIIAHWIAERLNLTDVNWSRMRLWETENGSVSIER